MFTEEEARVFEQVRGLAFRWGGPPSPRATHENARLLCQALAILSAKLSGASKDPEWRENLDAVQNAVNLIEASG